jgi:hypothetical protein
MRGFGRTLCTPGTKTGVRIGVHGSTAIGRRPLTGFWSWLTSKDTGDALRNKALQAHINPDGTMLPMLESPIKELRDLAQQYAANGRGCGACKETKIFSCPQSGFPTHCTKQCYDEDASYKEVILIRDSISSEQRRHCMQSVSLFKKAQQWPRDVFDTGKKTSTAKTAQQCA